METDLPEAPLWSFLSRGGLDAERPASAYLSAGDALVVASELEGDEEVDPARRVRGEARRTVTRYGVAAGALRLVPGQSAPPRFRLFGDEDPAYPPHYWSAPVAAPGGPFAYARALRSLTRRLGEGAETSVSNTRSREWSFGLARLGLTYFPPHLQREGHRFVPRDDPHPASSLTLSVEPVPLGLLPLPAPAEEASLAAMTPWQVPGARTERWGLTVRGTAHAAYQRRRPSGQQDGLLVAPDGSAVAALGRALTIVGRVDAEALSLTRLTPGKGGGSSALGVLVPGAERPLALLDHPDTEGLDEAANRLSERTGLPLRTQTYADC